MKHKQKFPAQSSSFLQILTELIPVLKTISSKKVSLDLGSLDTPTIFTSKLISQLLVLWNSNHLGNWSMLNKKGWGTQVIERKLIQELADLFHSSSMEVGGYVTGGASEGNLFLIWNGREKLRFQNAKKICLLKTSLTHYSLDKSARIADIDQFTVPLNRESWAMDINSLEAIINTLLRQGYDGFIIPFTLGYSATGTIDDVKSMVHLLEKIKKEKHINTFCWVDAALNGVFTPFIDIKFLPFSLSEIQGIVLDFHKFGLTPPSSGVVLYRQSLLKFIQKKIEYLENTDATLLGGRSGIPSVVIWSALHFLGRVKLKRRIENCFEVKKYFISKLDERNIEYITDAKSITLALLIDKKHRLPKEVESDFRIYFSTLNLLFEKKSEFEEVTLYKIFILPHVTKKTLDQFLENF